MNTDWQAVVWNVDGTLAVDDLPLLDASANIRGIQRGLVPPSTQLDTGSLKLYSKAAVAAMKASPNPDEVAFGLLIEAANAVLQVRQRCELYYRGTPTPLGTFRLSQPHEDPDSYTWDLIDTQQDMVDGKTEKQEFFTGVASDLFTSVCLKDWELLYGDDFTTLDLLIQPGPSTAGTAYAERTLQAGYTNPVIDAGDRHWIAAYADAVPGAEQFGHYPGTAITDLSPDIRYLLHNREHYGYDVYEASKLRAHFVLKADASAQLLSAGVIFGYDDGSNAAVDDQVVAEIQLDVTAGAGQPAVATLRMTSDANGHGPATNVYFSLPVPQGVIASDGSYTCEFQLEIYTKEIGYRMLVDGQEIPGATVLQASPFAWGSVGLYAANGGGAAGGMVFASDLYLFNKQPFMQPGAITATATSRDHGPFNETQLLEFGAILAGQEDFDIRKNPRRGVNQDTVDFGPDLGRDTGLLFAEITRGSWDAVTAYSPGDTVEHSDGLAYSALTGGSGNVPAPGSAHWRVIDGRIMKGYPKKERNQQKFATELVVSGKGTGATPPTCTMVSLPALRRYGRVSRAESQPDINDFGALRRVSRSMIATASVPEEGMTVQVEFAGLELQLRELDTAEFYSPAMGLNYDVRKVMGLDLSMGSPLAMLYLDQHAAITGLAMVEGMASQINKLVTGGLAYTTSSHQPGVVQTPGGLTVYREGYAT